jgi:hypothetical protein
MLTNRGLSRQFSVLVLVGGLAGAHASDPPDGWQFVPVRNEVAPDAHLAAAGSSKPSPELTITAGDREGLAGAWVKTFPVEGGKHYEFSCVRYCQGMASPRRSALAKITWLDADGSLVDADHGDKARPEFPLQERRRSRYLVELFDRYEAPAGATQAKVELQLRWARNA